MKKVLCGLLVVAMVFSLAACGKDSGLSSKNKATLNQIIKTCDRYLDEKISSSEASSEIRSLRNKFEEQEENSDYKQVLRLISSMQYDLTYNERAKVLSARNSLEKYA